MIATVSARVSNQCFVGVLSKAVRLTSFTLVMAGIDRHLGSDNWEREFLTIRIFIHQADMVDNMVDVDNNTTRKKQNLNNSTKQSMFVHKIKFVNNIFFKQFAHSVFRVL